MNQTAATTFFPHLSGGWQWWQELGGDGLGIVGGPGVGSSQRISPWPGPTEQSGGGSICQHGKVRRFSRFHSGSRVGIRLEHVWFWSFWTSLSSICWCWRLCHITSPIVRWMMWTSRILTYIYHARNPIFIDDFPTFSHNVPHNVPHSFPIICPI